MPLGMFECRSGSVRVEEITIDLEGLRATDDETVATKEILPVGMEAVFN